jgi:hypothetical protein
LQDDTTNTLHQHHLGAKSLALCGPRSGSQQKPGSSCFCGLLSADLEHSLSAPFIWSPFIEHF